MAQDRDTSRPADLPDAGKVNEPASGQPSRHDRRVEIITAVVLSAATVLAAWSAFQSAKWSGVQSIKFSQAAAARTESVRASTTAGQQTQIDVGLFLQWVNAYAAEESDLADFYFQRFRPEFRPAVDAWLATKPLKTPDAPASPFAMPQYRLAASQQASELEQEASLRTSEGLDANQRSDNYVLTTVLFASVLLFAGLAPKFAVARLQMAMAAMSVMLWLVGAGILVALPKQL